MSETEKQFNFEIVCPDRKIVSDKAWQVVVPGDDGDFGVLANHSAVVSSLRAGVVTIYQNEDEQCVKIFVSGGFVDVTSTSCTILADEAVNVDDLKQDELEQQVQNLIEDLDLAEGDADKAKVEEKLLVAKAKLSAAAGHLFV